MNWIKKGQNWLGPVDNSGQKIRPVEKEQLPGVILYVMRCPSCNSKNHRCYCSNAPIRYHKCLDCGQRFKSIEDDAQSESF